MKGLRRVVIVVIGVVLVAYFGGMALLYVAQRPLQYAPWDVVRTLADTGLAGAEAVSIPTESGAQLGAWYEAPQAGKPLIVYYHGNGENFTTEHERYEAFVADGYGFVAFDYRGFPASPGELSQDHTLADALAVFDWAKSKGKPLVIWGRSLGSAPATYVASQRQPDALLLEASFDSALSVARDRYWMFPLDQLMLDQYPSDRWMVNVTAPVFSAHGSADRTIAEYHGQRLYDVAPNKAGLWIVPGADHNDLWAAGIWGQAKAFFEAVERAKK